MRPFDHFTPEMLHIDGAGSDIVEISGTPPCKHIILSIHTRNVARRWRRKCYTQMAPLLDTRNDARNFHNRETPNEMSHTNDITLFFRKEMMSFSFATAERSSVRKTKFVTESHTLILSTQETSHSDNAHRVTTRDKADHIAGRCNKEGYDDMSQYLLRNSTSYVTTKGYSGRHSSCISDQHDWRETHA